MIIEASNKLVLWVVEARRAEVKLLFSKGAPPFTSPPFPLLLPPLSILFRVKISFTVHCSGFTRANLLFKVDQARRLNGRNKGLVN